MTDTAQTDGNSFANTQDRWKHGGVAPVDITSGLVRSLVRAQFPQWGDLSVEPVESQGWDNRTYRLGEELTVRLPSAEGYVAAR